MSLFFNESWPTARFTSSSVGSAPSPAPASPAPASILVPVQHAAISTCPNSCRRSRSVFFGAFCTIAFFTVSFCPSGMSCMKSTLASSTSSSPIRLDEKPRSSILRIRSLSSWRTLTRTPWYGQSRPGLPYLRSTSTSISPTLSSDWIALTSRKFSLAYVPNVSSTTAAPTTVSCFCATSSESPGPIDTPSPKNPSALSTTTVFSFALCHDAPSMRTLPPSSGMVTGTLSPSREIMVRLRGLSVSAGIWLFRI